MVIQVIHFAFMIENNYPKYVPQVSKPESVFTNFVH